ncbi:MAG TPA: carboxypeptidase-like regulatory domain-containing protein [Thermoanaerobaculia bacterium]|nr:carboxypeptidase-like regulatory domain-containing protein [Thermoanaerobaculia bacterium]
MLVLAAAIAAPPPAHAQDFLTGAVRSASGQAVPSVWVVLIQGATEQGRSLTGDDGKYYIGGLKSGDYVVQVKRGDAVLLRSTVHVPVSGNYDLRLP